MWRDELRPALAEARRSGRPLFVTLRCVPCKQCSSFDKDVLEGSKELSPLLARFVTVRLTDAFQLDANVLPFEGYQDTDLSWWAYFVSPEGRVYGIFGGRDEVSDASRISEKALVNSLRRVLDHHSDPRRKAWNIDGKAPDPKAKPKSPAKIEGYKAWVERTPHAASQSCLHCHQVGDIVRQAAIEAGKFDKKLGTTPWPLPENVGLVLDRDDGLLVREVRPKSPAAKAGLRAGDRLAAAGARRLFGQADLRGVLHRSANPSGKLRVHWMRDGERHDAVLELAPGWRRTVLDWRMSISQGNIGASLGFFPLKGRWRQGDKSGVAIRPFFGRSKTSAAYRAGLRAHHLIIALDDKPVTLAGRGFLVRFRLAYDPGDTVTFAVLDRGKRREIKVKLDDTRLIPAARAKVPRAARAARPTRAAHAASTQASFTTCWAGASCQPRGFLSKPGRHGATSYVHCANGAPRGELRRAVAR